MERHRVRYARFASTQRASKPVSGGATLPRHARCELPAHSPFRVYAPYALRHLVDTVTGLADRGIGFRSLQEAIDTTTPGGKLVFHVFAALAEFERDLIRERTNAGLTAARARGRHGGRPSVMTVHKVRVARDMYASKQYTVAAIARTLGVSRASIYRNLAEPRS
jgi:DNA invertase Pin-like site-specific DNA recombinase